MFFNEILSKFAGNAFLLLLVMFWFLFLKQNNTFWPYSWKPTTFELHGKLHFEKNNNKIRFGPSSVHAWHFEFLPIFIDLIVWFISCCCLPVYLAIFHPKFCLFWMTNVLLSMLSESFGAIYSYGHTFSDFISN